MKRPFLKIGGFMFSVVLLTACHKDSVTSNQPEFPTQYSELTVEQNKQKLEDNGIQLVNDLTSIKSTTGVQTSIAFNDYLSGSTTPGTLGGRSNEGLRLIDLLASYGRGKSSAGNVLNGMRSANDGFNSFQHTYDTALGIYTYSKANNSWSYEKTGDKIVFKFPSTKTGTANNAEYAIYGYKGVKLTNGIGGGTYDGDYPAALKADLTVDGAKKMGYEFTAAYNSTGTPSAISITISIDNFTFKYSISNTTSEEKVDYSLLQDNKILFAFGESATGTFSEDKITNSTNSSDVITKGSAYFQLLNIKFSGEVDNKVLADALKKATTDEAKAKAWNDNYKLLVYYADSKKKIADTEFYAIQKTNSNPDGGIDVRLVFADGSKSDLATYTDVGFKDLQTKFNDFVDSL